MHKKYVSCLRVKGTSLLRLPYHNLHKGNRKLYDMYMKEDSKGYLNLNCNKSHKLVECYPNGILECVNTYMTQMPEVV